MTFKPDRHIKRHDKAYMLTKSAGANMKALQSRQRNCINSYDRIYKTENIVYNGHRIKDAIVAYYCRMETVYGQPNSVYVFSYNRDGIGGDYYLSLDFITEKEVLGQNLLPDHLFDL